MIWHQVLGSIWVPDITVECVVANFQENLNENKLPLTFVAFCDGKPVRMCSLRDNDGIRFDLAPWLGSLVVHPDQREGIALKLINAINKKRNSLVLISYIYLLLSPHYRIIMLGLDGTRWVWINLKVTM